MRLKKVTTLNTFGGTLNLYNLNKRYKGITDYFLKSDTEVIFFQEVFTYYHLWLLEGLLKKHQYCLFEKSLVGPKGGLVIFSSFPIQKSHYVTFSRKNVPYFPSSLVELLIQRGMLTAKIFTGIEEITIVNVHMTAVLNHDWSKKSFYYHELLSEISQFHNFLRKKDTKEVVIGGDFNIAKGTDLYHRLVSLPQLQDPFLYNVHPTQRKIGIETTREFNRIDYLFVYGLDGAIRSTDVVAENKVKVNDQYLYLSDHIGLEMSF